MDTPSPTPVSSVPASTPPPGLLGSKIPSTAAFAVAVLLFFMPFVDIKCNNMSLQQVSGIQLATGFKMKNNSSNNSFLDDIKPDKADETITKTATKSDKKDPNLFAMVALGLGVLGLGLSFTNAKSALGGAMVTGIASAGSLIGMMLDLKKSAKNSMPKMGDKGDSGGLGDLGDKLNISIDFTPWFYISVLAFLAAAFFCYRRMKAKT